MRPEINKEINDFVEEKKILSAYFMRAQIKVALAELEYDTEISEPRLLQAAHQFTKDIAKIKIYQNNNVLITKYVGYLAFWIRKTHPLGIVTLKAPAGAKEPAPATANSILSIYTIKNMLLDLSNAKDIGICSPGWLRAWRRLGVPRIRGWLAIRCCAAGLGMSQRRDDASAALSPQ